MITLQKQLFLVLLKWIHLVWFHTIPIEPSKRWIDQVEKWVKSNGTLWTISYIKTVRNVFTRFVCGHPVRKVDMILGIDKDGFPKVLADLKPYASSNIGKRYILTLLSISRCLPGLKDPDYSTITEPSQAQEETLMTLERFIPIYMEYCGIKSFGKPRWTADDFHYSNKSGPIGPSTLCAQADAHNISQIEGSLSKMSMFVGIILNKLKVMVPREPAQSFTEAVLGRWVPDLTPGFVNVKKLIPKELRDCNRRLSIVNDPEAKARIVAIFDYWSQTVLRKLHLQLFEILRRLPQDRTFTQDPFIPRRKGHNYHSLDLSAATDRFPIAFQKEVIAYLTDSEYSEGWVDVMVSMPFTTPKGDQILYKAGQPMGAYSSWAAFAVSHHVAVNYCAYLEGVRMNSDFYILLGDDIVINHDGVADRYWKLMTSLGVSISPMKTHVSYTTYEFAKRWFHYGKEVTGIQLAGFYNLLETGRVTVAKKWVEKKLSTHKLEGKSLKRMRSHLWKNLPSSMGTIPVPYSQLTAMLCQYRDRGIPSRLGLNIPDQVLLLYKCLGYNARHIESLVRKATNFNAMMKFFRTLNPDDVIDVIRKYNTLGKATVEEFLYPHSHADKWDFVLRHLYLAMDSSVQSKLNGWIDYSERLVRRNWPNIERLLDQSDMWKSPLVCFYQLPLWSAVEGVLKGAKRLLMFDELETDMKRAIAFTSIPDPDKLCSARASTRILNAQADLTNRFMLAVAQTAQGRPTMLQNFGNRYLAIDSAVSPMTLAKSRPIYHGLIPY